ncbi:MAG: hypothetical protein WAM14_04940 [Candidatus Nitrosopolaris sp.]
MNRTIPEEEIIGEVKTMGYIIAIPRKLSPSYYKLTDNTVIRAAITINYLIPNRQQTDGFSINSTNNIAAFVPKEKRKLESFRTSSETQFEILDEDVEFEVLQEPFSVYDLSNDFVLSIKTVVAQVKKTKAVTSEGEPIYNVIVNPILKFKKK